MIENSLVLGPNKNEFRFIEFELVFIKRRSCSASCTLVLDCLSSRSVALATAYSY